MISKNKAYMKMIYAVISFFVKYAEKIKENLKLQNSLKMVDAKVKKIEYWREIQKRDITGITVKKGKTKRRLAEVIFIVSKLLRSFAYDTKDYVLYNAVKLSVSRITKLGDTVILRYADTVKNYARDNFNEMQEYQLTQEMLDKIDTELESFREWMTKPKEARSLQATATKEIKSNMKELREMVVGSLDNSMALYISADFPFYEEYEKVRSIDDPITHHLDFWGHITDQETKLPIQFAAVTIVRFNASAEKLSTITKLSTKTGYYGFDGMEPDKYLVTFEFENYDKLEKEIYLHPGQSIKMDVALRKTE